MIARVRGKEIVVAALGIEDSEFHALEWCRETTKLMRNAGRIDVQAPDMYDRLGINTPREMFS